MAKQLVITGGRLIDPAQGIDGRYDIAVEDGRVVAIAPQIDGTANVQRIDAGGKLVTPGLIDFTTHINWGTLDCLDPDLVAARGAVTCNVDMGTVGAQDFVQFKTFIVKGAKSRVYTYLNASCIGM
jgi:dihydroorotase